MPNKSNEGIVPEPNDNRVLWVPVGCGNCIECRKLKAREWQVRLNEEIRLNKNGVFVTLTFNEDSINKLEHEIRYSKEYHDKEINTLPTIAVRRFLERWRKKYGKSVRHWLITELGHINTERIHLHGLIFTDKKEDIENIWSYGYVYLGQFVNEKTINYIVKYVTKIDSDHKGYKSKILCSKGIGFNYINRFDSNRNKFKGSNTIETYKTRSGLTLSLPIYYRNKIYNDEEREKLWLNKLDKEERWIMGTKIDISKGEEGYYNLLEHYRSLNKRLGYGDDSEDWNVKMYRKARARLKKRHKK